jgi:micrococcal nuclease
MIYEYKAKLSRIVDGDTLWLFVDLGFKVIVELEFRLYGLNTPEIIGGQKVAGLFAKAELRRLLGLGELRIATTKADKYGRWLATIFVDCPDGTTVNANQALLDGGFAKPYFGEGPKPV